MHCIDHFLGMSGQGYLGLKILVNSIDTEYTGFEFVGFGFLMFGQYIQRSRISFLALIMPFIQSSMTT